jgi:hypothetical protein
MNDEELDLLVAQSMYSNTDVRSLDLRVGEADLMENVMNSTTPTIERPQPVRHTPTRRRRNLLAGLTIGVVVATGAGVTYAVVADRLNSDQAELVDDLGATGEVSCGISSENARLVASTTRAGRTVEYWTVDDASSHGDLLFESGAAFGGGGCGPMSRAVAHPQLPWANYTLNVDPRDGTGLGHFAFLGQAPAGTAAVDIVTTEGTIRVDVTSPEGYFVVLADLPVEASPPPSPPPPVDVLLRIDAYAVDGTLLGTGGLS